MSNYKLKQWPISSLGQTKDDLDAQGIFRCYREGMEKDEQGNFTRHAQKQMAICGHYCVQDSALVLHLFNKTQTWIDIIPDIFSINKIELLFKIKYIKFSPDLSIF